MRPDFSAISRHEDGQIADEADALLPAMLLERSPLQVELVLNEAVEIDFVREFVVGGAERGRFAEANAGFPFEPFFVAMDVLEGSEEGPIVEP